MLLAVAFTFVYCAGAEQKGIAPKSMMPPQSSFAGAWAAAQKVITVNGIVKRVFMHSSF
jgi:hypothetical protein